jgi:hypothetical protein
MPHLTSTLELQQSECLNPTEVNSISAALKEKPDPLNADLKKKFEDLRFNLSILTRDRSQSAHNLDYALEIMALASSDLKILKAAVK